MPRLILALTLIMSPLAHAEPWWTVKPAPPERYSLLIGTAATLTALGLRYPLGEDLQTYESTHRPLGSWSKYGNYAGQLVPNVAYVAGTALASALGNPHGKRRAQVMTVATAEAGLITTVLKFTIGERRPNKSNWTSFPSGHATTVFTFAAVVGSEHGWVYGVPAYALAVFSGWSRLNDNMHYLHDVLAGATIGVSVGLGVAWASRAAERAGVGFAPMLLEDGGGLIAVAGW